jgi:hypothetical protein
LVCRAITLFITPKSGEPVLALHMLSKRWKFFRCVGFAKVWPGLSQTLIGIAGAVGGAIITSAVLLPSMLSDDHARISRLEEQVKGLSTPDVMAAACVEQAKQLAASSHLDAWNRGGPQQEKALQSLCAAAAARPATRP